MSKTPPITPELDDVLRTRVDEASNVYGMAKRNRSRMEREILGEIHALVRRPVGVEDITPEICRFLADRWTREIPTPKERRRRVQWFADVNAIAAEKGLAAAADFSQTDIGRRTDWKTDRRSVPVPAEVTDQSSEAGAMTLRALLMDHYRRERLVGKSPNTLRLYNLTIRAFEKWLGRTALVADLNTSTVADFTDFLLTETKLSRATIRKDQTQIKCLWNYAAKRRWVAEFPTLATVSEVERVPDSWSDDELRALLQACEVQEGYIGPIAAADFWKALLWVIWDTGERIGAVMDTARADLNQAGWLTIRGEHRKGGKRDKRFRLRPETKELLNRCHVTGDDRLLPWPYSRSYVWQRFGRVLDSAGLPNNRRSKFHKIRRSVASRFEARGGNATALLDHQHRKTTVRGYLDPGVTGEKQPADLLDPMS